MIDIGDKFPDITLTLPDGGTVKPSDYAGAPYVLYFYPKDDTGGCTKEAQAFSAALTDFTAIGVKLLGVSRDSPKSHVKFIGKYDLTVPLASDEDGALVEALGIWVEKSMYGKKYMGLERTTYLVGADGKVTQVWRKVKVPGHVDVVLAAAKAVV